MSSLARSSSLGAAFLRPFTQRTTPALLGTSSSSSRISSSRFASGKASSGDYGSGTGDPKGEDPLAQGESSSASSELEHPGPKSPAGNSSSNSSAKKSNDDDSSESSNTTASSSRSSGGENGAKPKILSESSPSKSEQSEETKQHNKEMDNRADKATEKVAFDDDEKVDKNFWKGQGGVDRDP